MCCRFYTKPIHSWLYQLSPHSWLFQISFDDHCWSVSNQTCYSGVCLNMVFPLKIIILDYHGAAKPLCRFQHFKSMPHKFQNILLVKHPMISQKIPRYTLIIVASWWLHIPEYKQFSHLEDHYHMLFPTSQILVHPSIATDRLN